MVKAVSPFLSSADGKTFRVNEAFRRFIEWDDFKRHVTQVRPVANDYRRAVYDHPVIFEFFMPLAHETHLRMTLDSLFFRDTIATKLKSQNCQDLRSKLQLDQSLPDEEVLERVADWIGDNFGGYSIYHVNGRFRAQNLMSQLDVAELQTTGRRYLIDETTAVTRFIFPCENDDHANLVRYFFEVIFVGSIIQLVAGEEEIWMVESGSQNKIHIWRVAGK